MYQALYRKYRPKNFDDVVGQEVIIQTLKNSILNNKISHAYLLSGPRGCGKTSIAKIFARLVNCEHPDGTNPCNNCVCCTQSDEQNLDIIEMDAASNNGVDEIREINNKVNLVPSVGKYKVYIIDEVHMLTIGAFNALLKTLEEPPKHVIFILATTDPNKVPITILSRCQRFDLKKISEDMVCEKVASICKQEKINITDDAIKEVVRLGDGSMRDTLSLLDQVISYSPNEVTIDTVHAVNGTISQKDISQFIYKVLSNDITGTLNDIRNYDNNGKSIIRITEEIILYLRNFILYKVTKEKNNELYISVDEKISVDEAIHDIKLLNETLLDMKKFTNDKLLLELAIIRMMHIQDDSVVNMPKGETKNNFPGNNDTRIDNIAQKSDESTSISKDDTAATMTKRQLNNDTKMSKINQFIDIRVSNTLASFSKKQTSDLKKSLADLNDYVMDEKNGNIASLILDGELKAVGEGYMIFTYKTSNLVSLFIENIKGVELLINNMLNADYKVVAVDNAKWDEIKEKFNSKSVKYTYQDEIINVDELLKSMEENSEKNDMQSLFGDIVEYE